MMKRKKQIAGIILLAEVVWLGVMVAPLLKTRETITWEQSSFQIQSESESTQGVYISADSGEELKLRTPEVILPKGVYLVEADLEQGGEALLTFYRDGIEDVPLPQSYPLPVSLREDTFSARLTLTSYPQVPVYAEVTIGNEAWVLMSEMRIRYLRGISVAHALIKYLALFAFVDAILYVAFFRESRVEAFLSRYRYEALALAACVFIASLPLFSRELSGGHDLRFHVYRLQTLAQAISSGDLLARVHPGWLDGYGYAVGVGYGQLLLYPAAFLYLCGFSAEVAYRFFIILTHVLSFLTAYCCGRELTGERRGAIVCGILYTLSFYRMTNVFFRAAAGEVSAMVFFPLIAAGLYRACTGAEGKTRSRAVLYLTAGATGVLQSQTIGVLLVIIGLLLFMVLFAREVFRRDVLIVFLKSALYAVLLNLWFLVPLVDYMRRGMFVATSRDVSESAMIRKATPFAELFLSHNRGYWMVFGTASLMLILLALFVTATDTNYRRRGAIIRLEILLLTTLLMATDLFPYGWLRIHLPAAFDLISMIQYAWRFIAVATILVMVIVAMALNVVGEKKNIWEQSVYGVIVTGAVIVIAVSGVTQFWQNHVPGAEEYHVFDSFLSASGIEFIPEKSVGEEILFDTGWPELPTPPVPAELHDAGGLAMTAEVTAPCWEDFWLDFPRLNYYGYRATADKELPVSDGPNGNVRVLIPAGFAGQVRIFYRDPMHWMAAGIVSILTLVIVVWRWRRHSRS